ncbi:IS4 family transposase [Chondrinema litorale]|uniref:IS4 family transposase n=1 Tax=Chondrinema litorale TaxID=2994555 RepID=UPI0032B422B3
MGLKDGNICYFFFELLKSELFSVDFQKQHSMKSQDFIRQRLLGFSQIAAILINRVVKNLSIEVSNFFNTIGSYSTCSKQAFSKARKKLKHTAFIALNRKYVQGFYQTSLSSLYQNTYYVFAVDGSLCQLPTSPAIVKHFGLWKNHTDTGMPMGRSCVVYDVLNHVVIQGALARNSESEQNLFRVIYHQISEYLPQLRPKVIWLMDRAYPSYDLCKTIEMNGGSFLIRCKRNFCKEVAQFAASDKLEARVILSAKVWYTKKGVKKESIHTQPLTIRVVKIPLSGGEIEYLITNLELPATELKILYSMRWGIETYYDYLKHTLELENFSSKTAEGILQDYHASLLTSNLIQLLITEAQQELDALKGKKGNKYHYQINKVVATGILRGELIKLLFTQKDIAYRLSQLKEQIKRSKNAVVPNRSFKRHKFKRSRRKFHLNKKKAL